MDKDITNITIKTGAHATREQGMCALEVVAYIAGETHSDRPTCACPVLAAFVRRLNDARWSSDAARTEALRPVVLALVGSRSIRDVEMRRMFALADYATRTCRLDQARARGWTTLVTAIEGLTPIVDRVTALAARDTLRTAYAADAAAAAAYAYAAAAAYAAADAYAAAAADAYAADAAYAYAYAAADAAYAYAAADAAAAYAAARDKYLAGAAAFVLRMIRDEVST
jgi:hypothetical protein